MTGSATEAPPTAAGRHADPGPGEGDGVPAPAHRWRRYAVAGGAYLALSVVLWWHVWTATAGPSSVMTCACTDAGRGMWYVEWSAWALTHGHGLFHSTLLFHPTGVNILSDTSIQAVGVVMTPVTLLFGPVVSFNLAATLTPVVTALSMFWLLQRWVRWTPAAFLGGLAYGFSTFVVVQLSFGWLNLALLALLPPMAACVDELLVRQRRRPVRVGVALGLLVTVEFFVSSEMVLIVVLAGLFALALLAGYAAIHDLDDLRRRVRHGAVGLATAAGVAVVLLAYPVWFFLAGPSHLTGTVWSTDVPGQLGASLGNFVDRLGSWGPLPPGALLKEVPVLGGYLGPAPSLSYLGFGLLAVLVAGLVVWRRDRRLWLIGALGLVTAAVSLQVGPHTWGPWSLVYHLPLFRDAVQSRFSAVLDLCAAVLLAIIVDRTRTAVARRARPWAGPVRTWAPPVVALAVAAVALVPVGNVLASDVPLTVQGVGMPRWFAVVAPTLPPDRVLMTYPFATADSQSAVPWQAMARMRYSMAGGAGPAGTVVRAGADRPGYAVLDAASVVFAPAPAASAANLGAVRTAMRDWQVTTVVVPDDAGLHVYEQARGSSWGVAFYTAVMGTAPTRQAGAWVWDGAATATAAPVPLGPVAFARCVALGSPSSPAAATGAAVASCVLRGGA